jgi:hypothetical protein
LTLGTGRTSVGPMIRVAARDKTGIVILRDYRDDGSYVLLECHEFEPSGGGGVLGLPEDDEIFPMLRAAEEHKTFAHAERTQKKPFSLEVDISAMPRGELRFTSREFIEQAAEEAQVAEKVKITPENAERWGFLRREPEAN